MLISHIIYDKDVCVTQNMKSIWFLKRRLLIYGTLILGNCVCLSPCAYLSTFMCAYRLSCPCVCKESITTNISMYREDIEDTRTCQPLITSCR